MEKISVELSRFDLLVLLTRAISPNHYLMSKFIRLGIGTFDANNGGWKWAKKDGKEGDVWNKYTNQDLFEMYKECRDSWIVPNTAQHQPTKR